MRSKFVVSRFRTSVWFSLGGRFLLRGRLHQSFRLQRLVMLLIQLAKSGLRKQRRHPQKGSMTQSLEVVHRQSLCRSQTVIAAKLDEPAERSDLRLCDTFDSTRQTLLHLHERVVLYITILPRLKDDLHKDQRAKRNARLTLKNNKSPSKSSIFLGGEGNQA